MNKIPGIVVADYLDVTEPRCNVRFTMSTVVKNIYGELVEIKEHIEGRCTMEFSDDGIVFKAEKKE